MVLEVAKGLDELEAPGLNIPSSPAIHVLDPQTSLLDRKSPSSDSAGIQQQDFDRFPFFFAGDVDVSDILRCLIPLRQPMCL